LSVSLNALDEAAGYSDTSWEGWREGRNTGVWDQPKVILHSPFPCPPSSES